MMYCEPILLVWRPTYIEINGVDIFWVCNENSGQYFAYLIIPSVETLICVYILRLTNVLVAVLNLRRGKE